MNMPVDMNMPDDLQIVINDFWNEHFSDNINKIGHTYKSIRYVIYNPKCIEIVNMVSDLLNNHNMLVNRDVDGVIS